MTKTVAVDRIELKSNETLVILTDGSVLVGLTSIDSSMSMKQPTRFTISGMTQPKKPVAKSKAKD